MKPTDLSDPQKSNTGNFRWVVVVLLFFATTINYIDRQVIGLLKPTLEKEFNWSETDYSRIVMAFSLTYAIGLLFFGRIIDKIGTKLGYAISIICWSIAAMLHSLVKSTTGFVWVRAGLGLGESGNFPAAIKAIAEWFPKKERALATGLFNSGASIGAVIAPIMVPLILAAYGWKEAFLITGALGFIWLIFWLLFYEVPSRKKGLTRIEYDHIHSDQEETGEQGSTIRWIELLGLRQTWTFITGKFLTDPIWWFFLFWLPSYFSSTFALDLTKPSLQLGAVYLATTVGSIGGGYLSSRMIKKGWPVFKARKTTLLIAALCVIPIISARYATNIWMAVGLISLAAAAHNAWSANIFTVASDMFPKKALSSVIGIGGMAGSVGGILFPMLVGYLLDLYKLKGNITTGYNLLFLICGCAYLLAWLIIHFLTPRMERVIVKG
ncbi:MAG: MFS transporter [Chitinophagaceae bacterium]|nr:MFS transporter [Chitinophagaceae bacterium]MCA6454024.1 MFS transporter [Chitinophagaceae bacterium]MCA6455745.1 MFS transporter [Chitinophagaceae bacterium]MCA6460451.1 MFS transporter [Chitinophagaceae bacterium]MCA6465338.1 MFS transporter [Chitinophagaceae bacterium]